MQSARPYASIRFLFVLPKHLHGLPLLRAQLLRYHYLYRHVLVAFLVVVRRQFLHAVVRYFLLVVVLGARIHLHPDVTVQRLDRDLRAKNSLQIGRRMVISLKKERNWPVSSHKVCTYI